MMGYFVFQKGSRAYVAGPFPTLREAQQYAKDAKNSSWGECGVAHRYIPYNPAAKATGGKP